MSGGIDGMPGLGDLLGSIFGGGPSDRPGDSMFGMRNPFEDDKGVKTKDPKQIFAEADVRGLTARREAEVQRLHKHIVEFFEDAKAKDAAHKDALEKIERLESQLNDTNEVLRDKQYEVRSLQSDNQGYQSTNNRLNADLIRISAESEAHLTSLAKCRERHDAATSVLTDVAALIVTIPSKKPVKADYEVAVAAIQKRMG